MNKYAGVKKRNSKKGQSLSLWSSVGMIASIYCEEQISNYHNPVPLRKKEICIVYNLTLNFNSIVDK